MRGHKSDQFRLHHLTYTEPEIAGTVQLGEEKAPEQFYHCVETPGEG